MKTQPVPDTLPQPDIRTHEERSREQIDRETGDIQRRRAEFVNDTISGLRIAAGAEAEIFRGAFVEAVRGNRPAPSRASLDKAETALLRAQEHLEAFDAALAILTTERQAAKNRELQAKRAADASEIMRLRAERPALEQALRAAQDAVHANRTRHQSLIDEHLAHSWAPPA